MSFVIRYFMRGLSHSEFMAVTFSVMFSTVRSSMGGGFLGSSGEPVAHFARVRSLMLLRLAVPVLGVG